MQTVRVVLKINGPLKRVSQNIDKCLKETEIEFSTELLLQVCFLGTARVIKWALGT